MVETVIERYLAENLRMYLDRVVHNGMTYRARVWIDGVGGVSKSGFRSRRNAKNWAKKQAERYMYLADGVHCSNCGRLDGWHHIDCGTEQG